MPGDVISFRSNFKVAEDVKHVVTQIVTAHGVPVEERPIIPSIKTLRDEQEAQQRITDLQLLAKQGDDTAAKRLLEHRGAQEVCEQLLDITANARQKIIYDWKKALEQVPDPKGLGGELASQAQEPEQQLRWKIRALLKSLKSPVKETLQLTGAETRSERRRPVNVKIPLQWENMVRILTIRGIVNKIKHALEGVEPSVDTPRDLYLERLVKIAGMMELIQKRIPTLGLTGFETISFAEERAALQTLLKNERQAPRRTQRSIFAESGPSRDQAPL
jgi:hypothetical protein